LKRKIKKILVEKIKTKLKKKEFLKAYLNLIISRIKIERNQK
jgi:hypothetical protein